MPDPTKNDGQPLIDRLALDEQFGNYQADREVTPLPNVAFKGLDMSVPDFGSSGPNVEISALQQAENAIFAPSDDDGRNTGGGGKMRTFAEVTSSRFDNYMPGDYNNEDAYGQTQSFGSKMVSGVGKGLILTGTTFLQSTAGLVNGVGAWYNTGRAASFYDNDFTRELDEINKKAEDLLPNYYTDAEKNADWYSPSKLLTGNFLWDGIVKNLGFAAGAALAGGVYASALKYIPLASRLFSVGKAAEALAATEEGIATASNAMGSLGKIKSLSDKFISSYNVLNPAGRAVVAGLSTVGEAGFEAYQNLNDYRTSKIQEYKDSHAGEAPKGADLDYINDMADEVGNKSFLLNAALLSATNYIQFPKILGSSYTLEKGMINGLARETAEIAKVGEKYAAKEAGKGILSTVNKIRPYLFSSSEAFEEGAQFAISKGTEDYYNKKSKGERNTFVDSLLAGVKETLGSNEGMESILTGGISGTIMTAKGRYSEDKEKSKNTAEAVESFNKAKLSDFTQGSYDAINRGVAIQETREQQLKEGKLSESKDSETDYMVNYLAPRIKFGRFDLVKSDIEEYRKLASTEPGFDQLKQSGKALADDTQEAYLGRIAGLERTAENMKSLYQSLNMRYGNAVDDKGKLLYTPAVMDKMVYSAVKVADYDKRIQEVKADLTSSIEDLDTVINGAIKGDFDIINKAFEDIETIDDIDGVKEDLAEKLGDVTRMAIMRDMFIKEYSELKKKPQNFQDESEKEQKPLDPNAPKETVTIKTKAGEREIEVGTEYVLGKVVKYNVNGKEVYRQPRLTILGKNTDGTIKIKEHDGTVRDVEESEIEDYNLVKSSTVASNPKLKFLITENAQNAIYTHQGIKGADGEPVKGRLSYIADKDQLLFTFRDKNGNIKETKVWNTQFKADTSRGFKEPIMRRIGELTVAEQAAQDEFAEFKDPNVERRNQERLNILASIAEEVVENQDKLNKLIERKTRELKNIQADLQRATQKARETATKKGPFKMARFKKVFNQSLDHTVTLQKSINELNKEIEVLEDQKMELENTKDYLDKFTADAESLPTGYTDFLNQLKADRKLITDAIDANEATIKQANKLVGYYEDALKYAKSLLKDVMKTFLKESPNVITPTGEELQTYLDNALIFEYNRYPDIAAHNAQVAELKDYLAYVEDKEIAVSEKKLEEMSEIIDKAKKELENLDKLLKANDLIYNKFMSIDEAFRAQKEQERILKNDAYIQDQLIGLNDNSVQNVTPDGNDFEPDAKKSDRDVVRGTKVPTRDEDTQRDHFQRSKRFGFRFNKLKNSDLIRGVVINKKNQGTILPGLVEHLAKDAKEPVDEDTTIALVFVRDTPSGPILVNEHGEDIPDTHPDQLNEAIYQVFPLNLTAKYANGKESTMFRESTSDEDKAAWTEVFNNWRENQLKQTSLGPLEKVRPSFGILEYVTKPAENAVDEFDVVRDYDAKITVEESGLVSESDLDLKPVLRVGTKSTESNESGSQTFHNASGRVFLRPDGALVPMNNRQFTENEATVMFDVIMQAAKNSLEKDGLRRADTKVLFQWLRSVCYWGTAKDEKGNLKDKPGYNNIWFDTVEEEGKPSTRLFISGKGYSVGFTPSELMAERDIIIPAIQKLYFNVNASMVNDIANPENGNIRWNNDYYEITGLTPEGKPIRRKWQNYQTFLLSGQQPGDPKGDGIPDSKRDNPTPLTTNVRPLTGDKNDVNRKGIYFTLTNTADDYNKPSPQQAPKPQPAAPKLAAPTAKAPVTPVAPVATTGTKTGIHLDGVTPNEMMVGKDSYKYTVDLNKIADPTDNNSIWKGITWEGAETLFIRFAGSIYDLTGGAKSFDATDTKVRDTILLPSIHQKIMPLIKAEIESQTATPAPIVAEPVIPTPGVPAVEPKQIIVGKDLGISLNGETYNTIILSKEPYKYTVDQSLIEDYTDPNSVWKAIRWEVGQTILIRLAGPFGLDGTNPAHQQILLKSLFTKTTLISGIQAQIDANNTPAETPFVDFQPEPVVETPVAPAPVVEDKVADIEKKRKDSIDSIKEAYNGGVVFRAIMKATSQMTAVEELEMDTREQLIDFINKAYDNDLNKIGAPVETKTAEDTDGHTVEQEAAPVVDVEEQKAKMAANQKQFELPDDDDIPMINDDLSRNRVVLEDENRHNITPEKWDEVEAIRKTSLPQVPLYRIKNVIRATNGRQVWGMFQKGAVYVYEKAEIGTAYHEIFEAVWSMFTPHEERVRIVKEFRNRPGAFIDRENKHLGPIPYAKATAHQAKEQMAEEWRTFAMTGQARPKSLIKRMFEELKAFIKHFFIDKDAAYNTKRLFERIGNGYYAKYNPYETKLAHAEIQDQESVEVDPMAEYRLADIPVAQQNDILQHMTYTAVSQAIEDNKGLFDIVPENKNDLYKKLYLAVQGRIKGKIGLYLGLQQNGKITDEVANREVARYTDLFNNVKASWGEIIDTHLNHLKAYDIQFDEADEENMTDESRRKDDGYGDARQIDGFRKAPAAVKLMLNTLPEVEKNGNGETTPKPSSINGNIILPGDKVFITLMNQLHDSVNPDEMLNRLRVIALKDPNYEAVYSRLTRQDVSGSPEVEQPIDYGKLNEYDLQLIAAFWSTMKKQNADSITVFMLPSGEIVVSDSTLTSAAKQSKRDMMNRMTDLIKSNKSRYFDYEGGKFNPTNTLINYSDKFDAKDMKTYTNFLDNLGIEFDPKQLEALDATKKKLFRDNVEWLQNNLKKADNLVSISGKTLDIEGRLFNLGVIKATIENPVFESTYFNLNGDKTQTFIGGNIMSAFHDVISKLKNLNDVNTDPSASQYKYLKTDSFAKGSELLARMFSIKTFDRREGTEGMFRPVVVDGSVNEDKGKKTESSKLTYKQRLIQEINLNLDGIFSNLVPGDASIEWAMKMFEKGSEFVNAEGMEEEDYHRIFKNYLMAEISLSREEREVVVSKNDIKAFKEAFPKEEMTIDKVRKMKTQDLRFFKDILSPEVYTKVLSGTKNKAITPLQVYLDNRAAIDNDVTKFIAQEAKSTEELLEQYNIVSKNEAGDIVLENIDLADFTTHEDFMKAMKQLSVNYIISNIEMHKLVYSDPYQYSDELKRIKNFNSPRQPLIHGSMDLNNTFHRVFNEGYDIKDIGYSDMNRDHFRSVTLEDVLSIDENEGYDPYEETDGGGWISMRANRVFRIHAGQWTPDNERQYRYDIAYEKFHKGQGLNEAERAQKGITMSPAEVDLYKAGNPGIKDTYTPIKPIVSGSKDNGRDYNDIVLHKFALVPLSYRIQHQLSLGVETNIIKLHNKMQREDIDYGVQKSGAKVGAEATFPLYDENNNFNEAPFETPEMDGNPDVPQGISNIPFAIISIQSEVPSKDTPLVRQGSQITKLATMDFMELGIPLDFMEGAKLEDRLSAWFAIDGKDAKRAASPLYNEIQNNQDLLEAKIEEGYQVMLHKLGIEEVVVEEDGKEVRAFELSDKKKLVKTLKDEVLKRAINGNIIKALEDLAEGSVLIEATPVYQQIRNILFSIADKNVVSPKISGGMKVQITSALLESERVKVSEINGKPVYSSNELAFYKDEDGKRVCEVMVGRWFKSDMSDEELLNYLNNTDEGKKILEGIGFRIPTQKQNSIDVFRIKKFLPEDFSDSIVIPSALVKKAGSDFDIDKLSIYLKNVYRTLKGEPQIVPYYGMGQKAKDEFARRFDAGEYLTKQQLRELQEEMDNLRYGISEGRLVDQMFSDFFKEEDGLTEEDVRDNFIEDLIEKGIKKTVVDAMYMKSLENEYIQSLQNLVSHPLNYDNLVKPNDAKPLSDLAADINKKLGKAEVDYSKPGNMLSRAFMSELRQDFVSGKYAIGIAATAQTGHAQRQRAPIYIDTDRMDLVPLEDREVLGANPKSSLYATDTEVNFKEYNKAIITGKDGKTRERPILSMIKNKSGEYISDIIGMFIDGYVDISKGAWIMQLGAKPNVASTWLYLLDLGIPKETVAYFMNQPIIKDYLNAIENEGYSWLFIDTIIKRILTEYTSPISYNASAGIPTEAKLGELVGRKVDKMSPQELAEQQYILKEFLKYAKHASHLFQVTQGSNFDTATLNDSFLIYKKIKQYEKGKATIVSSIDDLTNSSFIDVLRKSISNVRDAMSTILLSDRDDTSGGKQSIRNILEQVLEPFIDLNDRDFVKIAQKAVADLFDFAMQTNIGYNRVIADSLLGKGNKDSAAKEIIAFRDKVMKDTRHPLHGNIIIESLRLEAGNKPGDPNSKDPIARIGKPDNLSIAAKDGKAYNQDLIIGGFNELRENPDVIKNDLYTKLVRVALLQSGITNSPISFSQLLPYNDFKKIYESTLSQLETLPGLEKYLTLNVLQRNNWSNKDIVPTQKARYDVVEGLPGLSNMNEEFRDGRIKKAESEGKIPKTVNIQMGSQAGRSEFLVYTWEDMTISKNKKNEMKKRGDYSYIHKTLVQKVYKMNEEKKRVPLVHTSRSRAGIVYNNYVYKAINAWGDSFRVQEFYNKNDVSVLDNDFEKVGYFSEKDNRWISTEVEDDVIEKIMSGDTNTAEVVAEAQARKAASLGAITPLSPPIDDGMDFGLNAQHFEDMFYDQNPTATRTPEQKDAYLTDSTNYLLEHGMTSPQIDGGLFSKRLKELFGNLPQFKVAGISPITTKVMSIYENRRANGKSSMAELPEFIEKKFGKKLKYDLAGYEKLSRDVEDANKVVFYNLGNETKSNEQKMADYRDYTNKQNIRLKEASRLINNIFAQIDPSIPKLYPVKATPDNTPGLFHLAKSAGKPDSISQEDWDNLSEEERNKINEC